VSVIYASCSDEIAPGGSDNVSERHQCRPHADNSRRQQKEKEREIKEDGGRELG